MQSEHTDYDWLGFVLATALALVLALSGAVLADKSAYEESLSKISSLARDAKYDTALAEAEKLAADLKRNRAEQSAEYATVLTWMAFLHQVESRLTESGPLYEQAFTILSKVRPPDHPDIATITNNLGSQYQSTGRLDKAEEFYKRGLKMRRRALPADHPQIADSLNNIAQIFKSQGRYAEAQKLQERALEISAHWLPPNDPVIAARVQNLAGALELQFQFEAAEPLLRRALKIRKESQASGHPEIAGAISRLAENLYKQALNARDKGNRRKAQKLFSEAETLFREALDLRNRFQHANHSDTAGTLTAFARNQIEQRKYAEAETMLRRALAIRENTKRSDHISIAQTLMYLADVQDLQGHASKALELIRRATEIQVAQRGESEGTTRLNYFNHVNYAWKEYARSKSEAASELLDEALQIGQRAEQVDTALVVSRMAARFAAKNADLQRLVRERDDLLGSQKSLDQRYTASLMLVSNDPSNRAELEKRIAEVSKRFREIDAELQERFPEYFNLVRPQPLDTQAVASWLQPDEALITMVCGFNEMHVWAVSKDGSAWNKADVDEKWLSESVKTLRTGLDYDELSSLFDTSLSHDLYTKLLRPLEHVFASKAHLIVVPCGPLTSLPLSVLVKAEPPALEKGLSNLAQLDSYRDVDWLVRHHSVSVIPSAANLRDLRAIRQKPKERKPLVGFGDPQFSVRANTPAEVDDTIPDNVQSDVALAKPGTVQSYSSYWRGSKIDFQALQRGLPQLPETAVELRTVAHELGADAGALQLGAAASETSLKQLNLADYKVVYFATHGLIGGKVEGLGEPALALSSPRKPSVVDDGLLTASEVSQLKLDADWVVLAACNTAAADGTPGAAALSGLASAFFHAGARALLVSHWTVESETAARLTTETFKIQNRDEGIGRAEALRRAMLTLMMDRSNPRNAYPTFWAPFEFIGVGAQRSKDGALGLQSYREQ